MKQLSIAFLTVFIFPVIFYGQNYNKQFVKQVKKAIGTDAKDYVFSSYPIDNFGVLTFYEEKATTINQRCSPFVCINKSKPKTGSDEWMNLYNFVEVGSGGNISLNTKQQTDITLNTLLPKIFQVLSVKGKYNKKKVVSTNLTMQGFHDRRMEPSLVEKEISKEGSAVKKLYDEGRLVYVFADYVVEKMTAQVTIDADVAAEIEASLVDKGDIAGGVNVEKNDVSLSVKRTSQGTYEITFNKPVIIARLLKYQRTSGGLASNAGTVKKHTVEDPSLIK